MDRTLLERFLVEGLSLEQIGLRVDRDPSTVGYWVRKHGLSAAHRERCAPRGGLERDQLEALIAEGLSMRAIGERLGVSQSTVSHWLRRFGLTTARGARAQEVARFRSAGRTTGQFRCFHHGLTAFLLDDRGRCICLRCRSEAVARRRRRVKAILVEEAGGRCCHCGYSRYAGALHFHHVDPGKKEFSLSRAGVTRSLERARDEASKCVLLCSNCHAEVEGGVVPVAS